MSFQEVLFVISIVIGIALMLLLFWSMTVGLHHLTSEPRYEDMKMPIIGKLYAVVAGNSLLEFLYMLLMLESVFIAILIIGLIYAASDTIFFLISIWYLPLGMFCLALMMTWCGKPQSEDS